MASDWLLANLGALIDEGRASLQTGPFGTALKAAEYSDQGVPLISVREIREGFLVVTDETPRVSEETTNRLPKFILKEGDIVFGRKGGVDRNALITAGQSGWFLGSDGIRLRLLSSDLDASFFAFQMRSPNTRAWLLQNCEGTTMPSLNQKVLARVPIRIPDIDTQKSIATILLGFDRKIANNAQTNQTLEQIAQAIFKSWFVDFEPVKAKQHIRALGGSDEQTERAAQAVIAGAVNLDVITTATDLSALDRQLTQALGEKLVHQTEAQREQLTSTASLFSDQLVESELGLIPEGWDVSTIGEEVEVVGGGTPSTKNIGFWDGGEIHWTSPKDLSGQTDKILIRTGRKITPAGLEKISSGLLPVNTVLMSSRAPIGYLALAKIPVAINQGYIAMKCTGRMPAEYVIQWASFVMDDIKQRASGTTFAEISKKNFRIIPLLVPVAEVAQCYSRLTGALYQTITEKIKESFVLTDIRDALLPKLLSGEILPSKLRQIRN